VQILRVKPVPDQSTENTGTQKASSLSHFPETAVASTSSTRPFYTTKPKGTGLGLAISRQIIEDHNGTIEVDVTSPKGTAFLITMPI